ncbi:prolipoprotein diacylglyceryl transferase [Sphingomonas jatrophae]|uniref:Phosphatidylglycerol--prolipoprotein diacylglyceryl transferase n=1 Tax=Sphingomonas jatrophae TaxID=1166337 RepID=A0A1I6LMM8_9SPHN|nr:prolipoprotein diacylglyceryl transferase [Sphingomonas jatrophae]SFS04540.1 phosphatidylglycerol:prolipoprotein diacylglycerol transferase [Sphingomonas jatrophae]
MFLAAIADASAALHWESLGLTPGIDLGTWGGFHPVIRWYSLSYIAGILVGWWYLLKLLDQPGAPMARRHADDLVFYATLGILLGGRLAYVLFYKPTLLREPLEILKLWEGGMSFHGGLAGVILALVWLARRHGLSFLRICDYVACVTPFGLFFGRIANFVNGELWGRPTSLPWGIVFPRTGDGIPRHPSQLYEALLEGVLLFVVLNLLFWRTQARYQPGKLWGVGLVGYGLCRFLVEMVRQPDEGLEHLWWGLSMGQTLSLPMIAGGLWLIWTAPARRVRVEPIAGNASVA